jgi:hypothetical protein
VPFIVDPIGDPTAPLLKEPIRSLEQFCVNCGNVIFSEQSQFSERRPSMAAFLFCGHASPPFPVVDFSFGC